MFKDMGNLGQVMKLQKQMKSIQKSLKKKETTGESSDGSVTAKVNGVVPEFPSGFAALIGVMASLCGWLPK